MGWSFFGKLRVVLPLGKDFVADAGISSDILPGGMIIMVDVPVGSADDHVDAVVLWEALHEDYKGRGARGEWTAVRPPGSAKIAGLLETAKRDLLERLCPLPERVMRPHGVPCIASFFAERPAAVARKRRAPALTSCKRCVHRRGDRYAYSSHAVPHKEEVEDEQQAAFVSLVTEATVRDTKMLLGASIE